MSYFLYLFGFLPSLIWLLFYLRKDAHPESNKMILKIFFLVVVAAFCAIVLEKGFAWGLARFNDSIWKSIVAIFIGGALVEEALKFAVVRLGVFNNSELDEPLDFMLYMIISALGFASLENILVLSSYHPMLDATTAVQTMLWRFVSATFLHALCSAMVGYFLILSFCHCQKNKGVIVIGLIMAAALHGLYNFSIMKVDGLEKFLLPIIILIGLAIFISFIFKKVKNLKGICSLR